MGTSFLLDFERIDTALAGLVPRELVALRGEWSSKAQRRYESAGQLGSGTGPFVEVVDRRWRGTLVSPTAFTGMAFLATDTEVHWVKASHAALTLDVEVSLHAYADFSADRATFAARFADAGLPSVAVQVRPSFPPDCIVGPSAISTGQVTCLARADAAAFYVLLLPRIVVQFGRNRLWRFRDRLAAQLPAEVRDLLTRRRTGAYHVPLVSQS